MRVIDALLLFGLIPALMVGYGIVKSLLGLARDLFRIFFSRVRNTDADR